MPTLAVVDGMRIVMYWNDHPPAHFHVLIAENRAVFEIGPLRLMSGRLPKAKVARIQDWAKARTAELMRAWDRVQAGRPVGRLK
jgi:hypothetical protein